MLLCLFLKELFIVYNPLLKTSQESQKYQSPEHPDKYVGRTQQKQHS